MNKITLNFTPCSPAPAGGYRVHWRVVGSGDSYTDAGVFFISPAIFYDTVNLPGSQYEGIIQSVSGDLDCNEIVWSGEESGIGSQYEINLIGTCSGINSNYLISGGTAGDIVTVRAQFGGLMQKIALNLVRADLLIFAGASVPGSVSSDCYSDTAPHSFSIFADTIITMPGATETVTLNAVVNNSSESATSVVITIIDINGTPQNIFDFGCRGNSSMGGTC